MKASLRCKTTHQGDRCQFADGHLLVDNSNDPMQSFHVGKFTVWDAQGELKAKAVGAEITRRRNRQANRVSRFICAGKATNTRVALEDCDKLLKFYGKPQEANV